MDTRTTDQTCERIRSADRDSRDESHVRSASRSTTLSRFRAVSRQSRRWRNFKAHRRGYWSSFLIFPGLFLFSLFAEFVANDRPIMVNYKGEMLFPVLVDYPEAKFGGFLAVTDYRGPDIANEIEKQRLDALAADQLLLRYDQQGLSRPHQSANGMCLGYPGTAAVGISAEALRCAGRSDRALQGHRQPNWLGTRRPGPRRALRA